MRDEDKLRDLRTPSVRVASSRWLVLVMAKLPEMGRVKTRLGREIGAAEATRFYRSTAKAVLTRIGRDPRFTTIIALSPDTALDTATLPLAIRRTAQGRGDLGVRMQRLATKTRADRVLVVGTDIPGITAEYLVDALKLLGRKRVVFGPADDGGFWLVGFRKSLPLLHPFTEVRWSSAHTLSDARANLIVKQVGHVGQLSDVDTADDLARSSRFLGRVVLPRV
jgi:uncharacterized protein